jgi:hypothetical protein
MYQYRVKQVVHAMFFTGALTALAIPAIAQTAADNTKVNTQDRTKGAVTADQQKENAGDREVAQNGRSLSKGPYAPRTRSGPSKRKPLRSSARLT